jgi:hypothetical protein
MTFGYGQLSKFVQCPGIVHSEGEERVILYVRATYDQGISYYVLGPDKRSGKSPVGFLLNQNGFVLGKAMSELPEVWK